MSIIKSILHKYNATSKAYDTLHPETESAQVTDWNQGIVNTLASTALGGLVNTLTSDSLLAKMIQKVLTATGVRYNIDQNGYICFGSLFGGLIIQWVKYAVNETVSSYSLPISMNKAFVALTSWENGEGSHSDRPIPSCYKLSANTISLITVQGNAATYVIVIGSV